uniref:Retrovirus-related Pol polyprotein from transposon TNT 1-94 n=1 Tax=Cajanus cajan TaxID=3821 RepID=A0A151SIK5_CAJCA|nr:Retrovirus-related Pol polyprotein from transposon TNT 1-94 [Cajanus cajan]
MSKDMLTRVIGCKSSFQLWDKIHSYFHSHMNAKARQLRNELRSTTVENLSISEYVLRIQTLVDALTAIGDSVSPKEHLDIILEGLPEEYESTVSLISSRFDLLTIDEVETLLLGHGSRLDKFKKKAAASINVTTATTEPNPPVTNPQAHLAHQDNQSGFSHRRGGAWYNNQPASSSPHQNGILGPRPQFTPQVQFTSTQAQPQAMIASSSSSTNNWYPDSGASNHVTNVSQNIHQFTPFEGPDQIHVGNGQGLHINSTGVQPARTFSVNTAATSSVSFATWHSRLGHPNVDVMKHVSRNFNIQLVNNNKSNFCTPCCLGKSHRLPSNLSRTIYNTPFDLVYSDLWGPAPVTSTCGYQYYVTFVDAHTRFTWIYLLKSKAQTFNVFKQFHAMVNNQYHHPIKALQTDWGGEYRSFTNYLNEDKN